VLRAGIDDLRVLWMDGNSSHLGFLRQAVGQGLPVIVSYSPAEYTAPLGAAIGR
jgi:hypothetical protein